MDMNQRDMQLPLIAYFFVSGNSTSRFASIMAGPGLLCKKRFVGSPNHANPIPDAAASTHGFVQITISHIPVRQSTNVDVRTGHSAKPIMHA
jgi:hypothetical protein